MGRLFVMVVAVVCFWSLSGCQTPTVTSGSRCTDSSAMCEEPGIPFWTKVPRTIRTSQWLVVDAYGVSARIRTFGGSAPGDELLTDSPLIIPATKQARNELSQIRRALSSVNSGTLEGARKVVWDELNKLDAIRAPSPNEKWMCSTPTNGQKDLTNLDTDPVLVSNTTSTELVLEPKRYYWKQYVPLFGSAQGTLKLGDDGTLSESTTSVQDDTAKTLLSVFPATALLSKAFGVASAAAAATAAAAGTTTSTMMYERRTDANPGKSGANLQFQIVLTVTPKASVYTLKRVCEFGSRDQRCIGLEQVTIASAVCRAESQLVSVLPVSDSSDSEETPAYEVSGKIIPPKASK
jgi:hypothetical protein